ncbi:MAG: tRNA (adenosine(37)-N6)-threonylcarbamoyltransferase complex dimerization subunit type 1 TsaB [Candidatus Electrothrix sp. GW3-4]|uniref:tRNA (adenosine(37)-N6)-threonylcarbamoyltransferase complex dimerization subunit type 1 TsaB n=1 Tax=Candidatus Electrothrix sp. GW3-4 TaxID=3126740 RepID=UPI0030CA9D80
MPETPLPLILSLETATGCGSVALTKGGVRNGKILAEATAQPEITHSRRLLGSVEWVMQAAGIDWDKLDGIAISLGPGSFTGLRIGMAAAKGIVLASQKPLIGAQTLDAIALSCPLIDRPLWCLLDARKQEVYAACYQAGPSGLPERCSSVEALLPKNLLKKINGPALLAGPGVKEYHDLFAAQQLLQLIPPALTSPCAARIGFLAAGQLLCGETLDPATIAPMYVRASEAEVNLQKKNGS